MASLSQVKELLIKYNIAFDENSSETEMLLQHFARSTTEDLEKYFSNCIFLKKRLNDACSAITVEQVFYIISRANRDFIQKVEKEYDKFASQVALDDHLKTKIFASLSKDMLNVVSKTDKEMADIASKYVSDLNKVVELSNSFVSYFDEDLGSKLFTNCIKRMQSFYYSTNPEQISELFYHLKNHPDCAGKITEEDLVSISERCASFYSNATAEKIQNINLQLQDFSKFIYNQLELELTEKNKLQTMQYQTALNAKDLRNILLTTPTIFTENPTTINFNIDLIKGQDTIGSLVEKFQIKVNSEEALEKFKNISLSFSAIDMQKLYVGNLSALSVSPNVMLNALTFIDRTAKAVFGDEIAPEEYLSPETYGQLQNINKLYDSFGYDKNQWKNNLELLSKIVSKEKLKDYFLSSFKLANVPTEFIKTQIANTILASNGADDLEKSFDRLISKNFFWDVQNKKKSSDESQHTFEIPKYRIGNLKPEPIQFGVDLEKAKEFLAVLNFDEKVIEAWQQTCEKNTNKQSKKAKTETLDIKTVNQCNEILNLIRELNTQLNNKPNESQLFVINQTLKTVYDNISLLSFNTRNMETATKGLIVNVKTAFNDLSKRFNELLTERQKAYKDELKTLKKQYKQLSEKIDENYRKYQRYHDNIPVILKDYNELLGRQIELSNQIGEFRQLQLKNKQERFDRINKFSTQVYKYFEQICSATEQSLYNQLLDLNPCDHMSLFTEDILKANQTMLCRDLNIDQISKYSGQIFSVMQQLRGNEKYRMLYARVSDELARQGIYLDIQLDHSQIETFHGDTISEARIYDIIGANGPYNQDDFETVYCFNGILKTAWLQENKYQSKIDALEDELSKITQEIKELKDMIEHGYKSKIDGNAANLELEQFVLREEELKKKIAKLKDLQFGK